jgi:hypothetical protein
MNIYEKLQKCKYDLQNANLKKTGENKFSHYFYWELSDFQPTIVSLFKTIGLCSFISFSEDLAILTIVNIDEPKEKIEITSPMEKADLKGCHPIQNLGAVETYSRRYLYMSALDISEPDGLDVSQGQDKPKQSTPTITPPQAQKTNTTSQTATGLISDAQRKRLFAIAKNYEEPMRKIISDKGYISTTDILIKDYDGICKEIEELKK